MPIIVLIISVLALITLISLLYWASNGFTNKFTHVFIAITLVGLCGAIIVASLFGIVWSISNLF